MIGAVLGRNLRQQGRLIVLLLMALVGFEVMIIWIGDAMGGGPGLTEILVQLPAILQRFVETQVGELAFDVFPSFGFRDPAILTMAIGYIVLVATIPAGERHNGLLELWLARPLSRRQYLTAVVLQLVVAAIAMASCLMLGLIVGLAIVDRAGAPSWTHYLPCAVGFVSFMLAWGGIAMWLAAGRQRRGTIVAQLLAVIVIGLLLDMLNKFSSQLGATVWINPFGWFQPLEWSMGKTSPVVGIALLLGLFVVSTGLAFRRFASSDL